MLLHVSSKGKSNRNQINSIHRDCSFFVDLFQADDVVAVGVIWLLSVWILRSPLDRLLMLGSWICLCQVDADENLRDGLVSIVYPHATRVTLHMCVHVSDGFFYANEAKQQRTTLV